MDLVTPFLTPGVRPVFSVVPLDANDETQIVMAAPSEHRRIIVLDGALVAEVSITNGLQFLADAIPLSGVFTSLAGTAVRVGPFVLPPATALNLDNAATENARGWVLVAVV